MKVNGKIAVPSFLAIGILSAVFGYGKLNNKVETNIKDIVEIKKDTKKIPVIENDVKHIITEQGTIKADVKAILRAVK